MILKMLSSTMSTEFLDLHGHSISDSKCLSVFSFDIYFFFMVKDLRFKISLAPLKLIVISNRQAYSSNALSDVIAFPSVSRFKSSIYIEFKDYS